MILENLRNYKTHLDVFYSVLEENKKFGVADKLLIKKIFDEMVHSEAKHRLLDGETEDWAYNVACGWVAWQTYFGERKINLESIGF